MTEQPEPRICSLEAQISCEGGMVGKKDIGLKTYLRDTARYADLWNAGVFHGRQIVKAEELREASPVHVRSEHDEAMERQGDLVMKQYCNGQRFVVLALENQEKTDYAMPVRVMIQEALEYDRQLREIRRENERRYKAYQEGNDSTACREFYQDEGEFLYKVRSADWLLPVVTLVVYWGEQPWKGPKSLHEMICFDDMNTEMEQALKKLLPEYPLHFLDVSSFCHFEYFRTELGPLLEIFQKRNSRESVRRYFEAGDRHRQMDDESWSLLEQLTGSKSLEKQFRQRSERKREEKGEEEEMGCVIDEVLEEMAEERAVIMAEERAVIMAEERAAIMAEERAAIMAEERAAIMAEERAAIMAEKMAVEMAEERVAKLAEEAGMKITLTATAECVFNLLEEYGPIPSELRNMVLAQKELQTLKNWQKLAARVRSVEEFAQRAGLQMQRV